MPALPKLDTLPGAFAGVLGDATASEAAPAAATGAAATGQRIDPERAARHSPITFASVEPPEGMASRVRVDARTLTRGHSLKARLVTAINSEVPGPVTAVVEEDPRGIIPPGAILKGSYGSQRGFTSNRVGVVFDAVEYGGFERPIQAAAADPDGATALPGEVDRHYAQLAVLAGLNAVGGAAVTASSRTLGGDFGGDVAAGGVREGVGVSREIASATLDNSPTITVPAGTEFSVVLTNAFRT